MFVLVGFLLILAGGFVLAPQPFYQMLDRLFRRAYYCGRCSNLIVENMRRSTIKQIEDEARFKTRDT